LVLVASYFIGWLVLTQSEFAQLGLHIAGASIFASNFVLFSEVGYFDNSAATKPLIHLWSLGIEEQFYLLFPFALWLCRSKRNVLALLVAALVISFSLNIWFYRTNQPASFYLPPCRLWELLAGSILAYTSNYRPSLSDSLRRLVYRNYAALSEAGHRHIESIFGLLLLTISLLFTNDTAFPGWWSLLPVLGAILITGSGQHPS
jgi:peptidoglycan/LPS O-acetylase OafA/YrhL